MDILDELQSAESTGKLNVKGKGIKELPDVSEYHLQDVLEVDLSKNKLPEISQDFLEMMPELEELDASYNNLAMITDMTYLACLTNLNLSYNNISELPLHLFQLKLVVLNLAGNQLELLPKDIGDMHTLHELDISYNRLQSIPASIENLKTMTSFSVSNNIIKEIPRGIGNLGNLETLDLSSNKINRLPTSMRKLLRLETLTVEHNPIVRPPPEIWTRGRVVIMRWCMQEAEDQFHNQNNPQARADVWSTSTPEKDSSHDFSRTSPASDTSGRGSMVSDSRRVSRDSFTDMQSPVGTKHNLEPYDPRFSVFGGSPTLTSPEPLPTPTTQSLHRMPSHVKQPDSSPYSRKSSLSSSRASMETLDENQQVLLRRRPDGNKHIQAKHPHRMSMTKDDLKDQLSKAREAQRIVVEKEAQAQQELAELRAKAERLELEKAEEATRLQEEQARRDREKQEMLMASEARAREQAEREKQEYLDKLKQVELEKEQMRLAEEQHRRELEAIRERAIQLEAEKRLEQERQEREQEALRREKEEALRIEKDRALQLLEAERKAMQERLKAAEDAVRIAKEEEEIRLRQSVSPTEQQRLDEAERKRLAELEARYQEEIRRERERNDELERKRHEEQERAEQEKERLRKEKEEAERISSARLQEIQRRKSSAQLTSQNFLAQQVLQEQVRLVEQEKAKQLENEEEKKKEVERLRQELQRLEEEKTVLQTQKPAIRSEKEPPSTPSQQTQSSPAPGSVIRGRKPLMLPKPRGKRSSIENATPKTPMSDHNQAPPVAEQQQQQVSAPAIVAETTTPRRKSTLPPPRVKLASASLVSTPSTTPPLPVPKQNDKKPPLPSKPAEMRRATYQTPKEKEEAQATRSTMTAAKPALPPKPPGSKKWQDLLSKQRNKIQDKKASDRVTGELVNGLIRPSSPARSSNAEITWSMDQLIKHQSVRRTALETRVNTQTSNLCASPNKKDQIIGRIQRAVKERSVALVAGIEGQRALETLSPKDAVEAALRRHGIETFDVALNDTAEKAVVESVVQDNQHLEECLQSIESFLGAPVATLSGPFDLPRCLADGIILCSLLKKLGFSLPKVHGYTDGVSFNLDNSGGKAASLSSTVALLRAKHNVGVFLEQLQRERMLPSAVDKNSLQNDIIQAVPSAILSKTVCSLIEQTSQATC
eukprot:m.41658 g.41658  ORF g.41658 m.41658 type:complete len:1169 (+) comp9796_c0_seq1:230-3736(+)